MKNEPRFLSLDEVIEIHKEELEVAGGLSGIRDLGLLKSAVNSPKATFDGEFLYQDVFIMAATYCYSIIKNHPFLDGNKRTALAACLTFLYLNGYEINEKYDEELADKVIDLVTNKISKDEFAHHLKENSIGIFRS